MAPREPYKVHSLHKHIEDTRSGLSNGARSSQKAQRQSSLTRSSQGGLNQAIFGDQDDAGDEGSENDGSSDSDDGADFLRKLGADIPKRQRAKDEIEDSDSDRRLDKGKGKRKAGKPVKVESPLKQESVKGEPKSVALSRIPLKHSQQNGVPLRNGVGSRTPAEEDSTSEDSTSEESTSEESSSEAKAQSGSESGSESESEAESDPQPSQPAQKSRTNGAKLPKTLAPANAGKSNQRSEDETSGTSESDSESGSENAENSGSEDESESESESEKHTPAKKAKAVPATKGRNVRASTSSSSEESSTSENNVARPAPKSTDATSETSSSGDSDESDDDPVDESMHMEDREHNAQLDAPAHILPNFMIRRGGSHMDGRQISEMCDEAARQGKQFWYFTAPSNVPISVIENVHIPADRMSVPGRLFSHEGEEYGMSFDGVSPTSTFEIYIPTANSGGFDPTPRVADHVMHIRRVTQLNSGAESSVVPSQRRAPRQQPATLRSRPLPVYANTIQNSIKPAEGGEQDVDMAEAPAQPTQSSKSLKGRRDSADGSEEPAKKKKKKRKQTASDEENAAAAEQLIEESISAKSQAKRPKTDRYPSPDPGSEPAVQAKHTPILAPTVPQQSYSFSSLGSAQPSTSKSSPPPARTASKSKKSKASSPVLPAATQTPASGPRQTTVPLPPILGSSQAAAAQPSTTQLTPAANQDNKAKRKEKKAAAASSQAELPQSSQPASSQPSAAVKQTPVPIPTYRGSN